MQNRNRSSTMKAIKTDATMYENQTLSHLISLRRKPNVQLTKKGSQVAGFKIFNAKRYSSSNSSSTGSIFNRTENRSHLMRNYHTQSKFSFGKSAQKKLPVPVKFLNAFSSFTPVRNQHMSETKSTWRNAFEISRHIQKDLMSVDEALKSRLNSIAKAKTKTIASDTTNDVPLSVLTKVLKLPPVCTKRCIKQSKAVAVEELSQKISIPSKAASFMPLPKQHLNQQTRQLNFQTKDKTSFNSFKCLERHRNATLDPNLDTNVSKGSIRSSIRKRRYTLRNCVPQPDMNNVLSLKDNQHQSHKPMKSSGKIIPSATYYVINSSNFF